MRNIMKVAFAAAAMAVVGSAGANAKVTMFNNTGNSVWYTIYNSLGQSDSWGCITKGGSHTWTTSGGTSDGVAGMLVYVRGELKQNADCGGKTLSDTGRGGTLIIPSGGLVKTFNIVGGKIKD